MRCACRYLTKIGMGLLVSVMSLSSVSAAPTLQIAAAADLASCIGEINDSFSKSVGGAEVKFSIGSSGNFFAQIKNGAPYDVFLSADMDYPRELAKAGLADASSLMAYGYGKLVMWTTDASLNLDAGFSVLRDAKVQRIAIANPDVAPYGRAARSTLQKAGVWEAIKPKLVIGENVAQAVQFVETGNAQIGFIGMTHVRASKNPQGRAWPVPADLQPVMEQGGIVTAKGGANPLSAKYLDFLRSEAGRTILRKYGFTLPEVGH